MCSGNWNVYFSISLMKTYHWPCRMLVFQVGVGWKLAQMPSILQSLGEEPPSLLSLLRFCLFLFIIYHPHYWAAVSKTYTEFLVMRLPRWCVKNPLANAGDIRDQGSMPGLGRSPGVGHGNPLQYSCLENPRGREAWRATVHRVTKSQTHIPSSMNIFCSCPAVSPYRLGLRLAPLLSQQRADSWNA